MLFAFGPYELQVARRRLLRHGEPLHLTPKAFDLLTVLLREAPSVITKARLHEQLWPNTYVTDSALTSLVKELRRALDDGSSRTPLIRTVHSVGYAFVLEADLKAQASEQRSSPALPSRHWITLGGRRMPLHEGRNSIGRDDSADVRLDAASVSRRHACIHVTSEGAVLEDQGSKNGTRVREQPVSSPIALRDGDAVSFGLVVGIYHSSSAAASTQTQIGAADRPHAGIGSVERSAT